MLIFRRLKKQIFSYLFSCNQLLIIKNKPYFKSLVQSNHSNPGGIKADYVN